MPGQPVPPYQGVPFVLARDGDTVLAQQFIAIIDR